MKDEHNRGSGFERHVQTIIQIVITTLMLWVGSSIVDMKERIVRMEEKLSAVTGDRYTGSDAKKDFALIWAEIRQMQNRFVMLERNGK